MPGSELPCYRFKRGDEIEQGGCDAETRDHACCGGGDAACRASHPECGSSDLAWGDRHTGFSAKFYPSRAGGLPRPGAALPARIHLDLSALARLLVPALLLRRASG